MLHIIFMTCHPTSKMQEIGILKSISYDKNIVQFYGASMVNREPMLLLEFCEGGDLRSVSLKCPAFTILLLVSSSSVSSRELHPFSMSHHTAVGYHRWRTECAVCGVQALDRDNREHSPEMGRQLAWDHEGQYIAQDVARGLYFLHNIDVRILLQIDAVHLVHHLASSCNQVT
jgi:serine/threonine protein kinase